MSRPLGSGNKQPYPITRHRNFYWGIVDKRWANELAAFKRMHDRVRDGYVSSIEWPRTLDGFVSFLQEAGPIPTLAKPSIGRQNHALGYQSGNLLWEEHAINSAKRKGTRHERLAYQLHI